MAASTVAVSAVGFQVPAASSAAMRSAFRWAAFLLAVFRETLYYLRPAW
jgi:hypothetical protein